MEEGNLCGKRKESDWEARGRFLGRPMEALALLSGRDGTREDIISDRAMTEVLFCVCSLKRR